MLCGEPRRVGNTDVASVGKALIPEKIEWGGSGWPPWIAGGTTSRNHGILMAMPSAIARKIFLHSSSILLLCRLTVSADRRKTARSETLKKVVCRKPQQNATPTKKAASKMAKTIDIRDLDAGDSNLGTDEIRCSRINDQSIHGDQQQPDAMTSECIQTTIWEEKENARAPRIEARTESLASRRRKIMPMPAKRKWTIRPQSQASQKGRNR